MYKHVHKDHKRQLKKPCWMRATALFIQPNREDSVEGDGLMYLCIVQGEEAIWYSISGVTREGAID